MNGTGDFTLFILRKKEKIKVKEPEADKLPAADAPRVTVKSKKAIYGIALSPSGSLLSWNSARVWNVEMGQTLMVFRLPPGALQAVSLSGNGRVLAVSCRDQTIRVWDVPQAK